MRRNWGPAASSARATAATIEIQNAAVQHSVRCVIGLPQRSVRQDRGTPPNLKTAAPPLRDAKSDDTTLNRLVPALPRDRIDPRCAPIGAVASRQPSGATQHA